jgi:hypothetical protein
MSCWRFDLRRKFVPYLEGRLQPRQAKRLEKHMRDCQSCRAMFVRLRAGHQLAQRLRHLSPDGAHRVPEVEAMMDNIGEIAAGRHRWARAWENLFYALTTPRVVQGLTVLVLVLLTLLVVSNRRVLFGERNGVTAKSSALDFSDFHPLSIPEIQSNTQPHISTEGYVREMHVDKEERTLHFKLAEMPQGAGPFVVCEIISPMGMPLPREGSRVRVYGVARYDAQPGREWHEVNPVLNIAVLKH